QVALRFEAFAGLERMSRGIVAVSRRLAVALVVAALTAGCQRTPGAASASSASAPPASDRSPTPAVHPFDPLTADEIRVAIQIARSDARFARAAFPSVAVQDPAKADVLAWQPGQPLVRQARVQAMTTGGVSELLIDLAGRRIVSAMERRGA